MAGVGVFSSLTALFAAVAIPKTDPASTAESVLWLVFAVGFVFVMPLVLLRLKDILLTLGYVPTESNNGFNLTPESSRAAKPAKPGGRAA